MLYSSILKAEYTWRKKSLRWPDVCSKRVKNIVENGENAVYQHNYSHIPLKFSKGFFAPKVCYARDRPVKS